jgi:hypothetical protein
MSGSKWASRVLVQSQGRRQAKAVLPQAPDRERLLAAIRRRASSTGKERLVCEDVAGGREKVGGGPTGGGGRVMLGRGLGRAGSLAMVGWGGVESVLIPSLPSTLRCADAVSAVLVLWRRA